MVIKRNFLLLLVCLIGFYSCDKPAPVKTLIGRSYDISGQVAQCEGCEVVLQLYDYNQYKSVAQTPIEIDTVKNGAFYIFGRTTRPGFYEIKIKDPTTGQGTGAKIYLPARSVKVTANLNGLAPDDIQKFGSGQNKSNRYNSFANITVESLSAVQEEINRYVQIEDSLAQLFAEKEKSVRASFRATYASENPTLINAWADSVRLLPLKYPFFKAYAADLFIRQHPQSEAAIMAMLENHHEKTTNYRFSQYFKALSPASQKSFYGQILAQKLAHTNKPAKYKQHWVGSSITYLKGKTPGGENLEAKEIFKRNKFTLVQFWASWHAASRAQMPAYQKIYRQNQPKGLEIIAVSFDYNLHAWTQTIQEEGLAFRQVSELQGVYAEEYKRFRIKDIPFNILFDSNGTMVAVDLTPEEVARKLAQVL